MTVGATDILVLRALGLGDFLTGIPALRGLRRQHPDARITLATDPCLAPLVRAAGCVDALLPALGLQPLATEHIPDIAVNLHGKGPQSTRLLVDTGARCVYSHADPEFPGIDGPPWQPRAHEIDKWCRLVNWYGRQANSAGADPADLHLPVPQCAGPAPGSVVLHVGAGAPARRWPPENFAEVAAALTAAGHRVVVTGDTAERAIAQAVASAASLADRDVLAGALQLEDLAALVARASLVICGDTGVAHLATAFGTPSVVLFGPTDPQMWGPPQATRHRVLWAGLTGDPHADTPDAGLLMLRPDDVLHAVAEMEGELVDG